MKSVFIFSCTIQSLNPLYYHFVHCHFGSRPKVHQFNVSCPVNENILRFDISVNKQKVINTFLPQSVVVPGCSFKKTSPCCSNTLSVLLNSTLFFIILHGDSVGTSLTFLSLLLTLTLGIMAIDFPHLSRKKS